MSHHYTRLAVLFLLFSAMAFAQAGGDPFSATAQGVSTVAVRIATYLGIIMCIACAFGLAMGEHHMAGKIAGIILGLIFALGATPIVTWIQSLVG